MSNHNIALQPQTRKSWKSIRRWNIKYAKQSRGPLCSLLLFTHAFLGCDITSRIFGIGKAAALKKLENTTFCEYTQVFSKQNATKEVVATGEKALAIICGGNNENLNQLRYR